MKRAVLPFALMGALLGMWGSFAAVGKIALGHLDSFQLVFYLFASSALVYAAVLLCTGKFRLLAQLSFAQWALSVGVGTAAFLYYTLYMAALKMIPVVEASMLNYTFPVFLVLLSAGLRRERLGMRKLLPILSGFLGMLVMVSNGQFASFRLTNWEGDLLAVGGAFCWALFSVLGSANRIDPLVGNALYVGTGFGLAAAATGTFSHIIFPDVSSLLLVVWLGASSIAIPFFLWFWLLRSASLTLVAGLSFLTPFVSLMFTVSLLGETVSLPQMGGVLLIAAGIALQLAWNKKKRPPLSFSDDPASRPIK